MENIGGRDVDFRKIQDIASESDGYRENYVRFDAKNYSRADLDSLQEGNGGYVITDMDASRKANRYARLAMFYKRIADKEEDDVKDDEGRESDGEFMRIDKHGDEWLVHVDKEPEQKFDSLHEALDYVMTLHGDERFEEDDHEAEDKKKEEEARRAARLRAIYRARKASGINAKRAMASRVIASPVNDDRAGRGLYN